MKIEKQTWSKIIQNPHVLQWVLVFQVAQSAALFIWFVFINVISPILNGESVTRVATYLVLVFFLFCLVLLALLIYRDKLEPWFFYRTESGKNSHAHFALGMLVFACIFIEPTQYPQFQFLLELCLPIIWAIGFWILEWIAFAAAVDWTRQKRINNQTEFPLGVRTLVVVSLAIVAFMAGFVAMKGRNFPASQPLHLVPGIGIPFFQVSLSLLIAAVVHDIYIQWAGGRQLRAGWAVYLLLWSMAVAAWWFLPAACGTDRPGPYLPNNVCYPQVTDSVYSIGSHYIGLGQGVLNHWFTDKPLYMIFLSAGQALFGWQIDHYLAFQVLILALMIPLGFAIGKRLLNPLAGLCIAILLCWQMAGAVVAYPNAGGVNVWMENSELLTAFLVMVFSLLLWEGLGKFGQLWHFLLAGGVLALAGFTRLNSWFIIPGALVLVALMAFRQKRRLISSLVVFGLGLLIISTPAIVFNRSSDGNIYILQKMRDVLFYRYDIPLLPNDNRIVPQPTETAKSQAHYRLASNIIIADPARFFGEGASSILPTIADNFFKTIMRFPLQVAPISMTVAATNPVWDSSDQTASWNYELDLGQLILIAINFCLILLGVALTINQQGGRGWVFPTVFFGYHFGNGVALTSGGRYLDPVWWIPLAYYCVGIISLLRMGGNKIVHGESQTGYFENIKLTFSSRNLLAISVAGLLLTGSIFALPDLIPSKFKPYQPDAVFSDAAAKAGLPADLGITVDQLVVVEGFLIHPRVYRSEAFHSELEALEVTILGSDRVYVANYYGQSEIGPMADGSRVRLVGCKIRERVYWGVPTILVKALIIDQLDDQQEFLSVNAKNFSCQATLR